MKKKKQPSYAGVKIFSLILLVGTLLGVFLPFYFSINLSDGFAFALQKGSILGSGETASVFTTFIDKVGGAFAGDFTLSKLLEVFHQNGYLVGVIIGAVLILISTVCAFVSKKAARGWFRITCLISMALFFIYGGERIVTLLQAESTVYFFDIVMITGALAIPFSIFHAIGSGRKGVATALSLLSLLACGVIAALFPFFNGQSTYAFASGSYILSGASVFLNTLVTGGAIANPFPAVETYQLVAYIAFGVLVFNLFLTAFQAGIIKSNFFTVLRYLAQTALIAVALVMGIMSKQIDDVLPIALFTAFSVIALVIAFVGMLSKDPVPEEQPTTRCRRRRRRPVAGQGTKTRTSTKSGQPRRRRKK